MKIVKYIVFVILLPIISSCRSLNQYNYIDTNAKYIVIVTSKVDLWIDCSIANFYLNSISKEIPLEHEGIRFVEELKNKIYLHVDENNFSTLNRGTLRELSIYSAIYECFRRTNLAKEIKVFNKETNRMEEFNIIDEYSKFGGHNKIFKLKSGEEFFEVIITIG